jgi:hypothetical protein
MISSIQEDFYDLKYKLSDIKCPIIDDKILDEVTKIDNFFDQEVKKFQILNNGSVVITLNSLTNLKNELNDFLETADPKDDNYEILVICTKDSKTHFKIYSVNSFANGIPKSTKEQIRIWNQCLANCTQIVTTEKTVSIRGIETRSIPDKSLPDVLKYTKLKPEHLHFLVENLDSANSNYFKIFLAKYCLLALSSSSISNTKERHSYAFEGYARVVIMTSSDEEYVESYENIYDVYKLTFVDANFSTRLGLLRNIVSVNTSHKLTSVFDSDIIKVLHSNYQIYLRENIKQYIEVKNKTIELMHGLIVKATDRFEDQQKSYQKVAAAISTYIFTVVIGKFIFKSENNVFSLEISSISSVFILFSMVYLEFSQKRLISTKNKLVKSLDGLKKRYSNIMHETELEEIFNEPELKDCFNESNDFLSHTIYQTGLFLLLVIMWVATGINYFYIQ